MYEMKGKRLSKLLTLLLIIVLFVPLGAVAADTGNSLTLSSEMISSIEDHIQDLMDRGKIPGLSVVIVQGDTEVYQQNFGLADKSTQQPITSETLFELGSNSKVFTALGVLKLEKEGRLQLTDSVTEYLPWLELNYLNEEVDVTIEQFLHHTSGVPFQTIADIPESTEDDALEQTVKTLVGAELDHAPGSRYLYATINYDVLGLVIEVITGQSFEAYMQEEVLLPLGLSNTYLFHEDAQDALAQGYKLDFLQAREYHAPIYRGNTPAGYFISNIEDMSKWLRINMHQEDIPSEWQALVNRAHEPNRTIRPNADGSSYAAGWFVYQDGEGVLSHTGSNPNYSSYVGFRVEEQLGVAVLANLNSAYAIAIGEDVMDMLVNRLSDYNLTDMFRDLDRLALAALCITIPVLLFNLWMFARFLMECVKKRRSFKNRGWQGLFTIIGSMGFLGLFGYCLYLLPNALFNELTWEFMLVWAPASLWLAVASLFLTALMFSFYSLLVFLFPKEDSKGMFNIAILSVLSGLGNAFIIFTINLTLSAQTDSFQSDIFLYFVLGLMVYVVGQRIVRMRLVSITNNIVYDKRLELIDKILNSSYYKFDKLQDGKVHAGLNNDTEVISSFANTFITGITSLITLICCFIYLGIINWMGLIFTFGIIVLAVGLYVLAGMAANKLWSQTRDVQNVFFRYINDLTKGFKELSLNKGKRDEFKQDIQGACVEYRDKRIKADYKITNAFIIGEILFTLVIGCIAFFFPLIFKGIAVDNIRSYVFIFLYMVGPVHSILNAVPTFIQMRISWKRINGLINEITDFEAKSDKENTTVHQTESISLELKDLVYSYSNDAGESFTVGPINYTFHSDELVFITGGNGSGKSTIANLMTGLYKSDSGSILVNGIEHSAEELGQYFTTIFSDFYLFDKLYGIDYENKKEDIDVYLKLLKIEDKVEVVDGKFSTIKLSTGQRKRLALMVSYLEDKPIYLFDEWAADQDPEFRRFFYLELLPELKAKGKCIIAISHDDRYFETADRIIKMELGKMVESEDGEALQSGYAPVTG
ncbi:cyclic peptide export ABC transporter [Bacillus horti]|uniref:Cyclic peptide transporter n=1 Tax=Caldalkalibacillus horti TaxID=77523 RepID=A0ABT9W311_9BACI|nr:cyclic peptide export ABC transporter [Bacillus horti]MDQ0167626.1 cyclic peptide transporter [Bacillus horti]